MRSEDKRVPALRFEGFEVDWERKHIGDVFNERVESFPQGELLSVTTSSGIKRFTEVGRHDTSNSDKSKYRRVEVGDIAYNSMRMWQGASGRSPYLGIVSPAYTVLAPKEGENTGFFARLFKTQRMIQTFEKNSQGLTSDTWNLKFPALSRIEVWVPSPPEQHAISIVFDEIEQMISSSSDRLKGFTSLKQTMLVKMFPQNTASAPELRFEGFEGEWEHAEFGSLGRIVGGSTPATAVPEYWGGDVPWFTPAELLPGGSGVVTRSARSITEQGVASAGLSVLPVGTVLITSRASIGHTAVLGTPATTNQGFASLIPYQDESMWFVYYLVQAVKDRLEVAASGSTFLEISGKKLAAFRASVPSLPEQQAIGAYFRNLDALIDAEQKKLATLRNLKSALLTQMFV